MLLQIHRLYFGENHFQPSRFSIISIPYTNNPVSEMFDGNYEMEES